MYCPRMYGKEIADEICKKIIKRYLKGDLK